jgi:O-antigen/teichoic acid export membrane protein
MIPAASSPTTLTDAVARPLPPVLGRLLRGSFWLALRTPMQAVFAFITVPLLITHIGVDTFGAYGFAWGFGFIQFLMEFGMSSALQRQVSDAWTRGDRDGVDRAIACGIAFYATLAVAQASVLVGIALWVVPHSGFAPRDHALIVKLLYLQAATAPLFGLSTVVSSMLQAARRYDFLPRLDLAAVLYRFVVLVVGLEAGVDFFLIVVLQMIGQVLLLLGPSTWVLVRELGFVPRPRAARWSEFRVLWTVSSYVFLIQLSVVLADRVDTTVLGLALPEGVAGPAVAVYQMVSKPFTQIRQTGWTLTYLVMPAVASLAAAGQALEMERLKYDGSRMLIGLLAPIGLLAAIDARPFLSLWVGPSYAPDAWLLQLFLVALLPLSISVLVQMSIGLGHLKAIAISALAGAVVNLPLSYVLTLRLGVSGVIWGTVLTTLFSNLLVPGWYTFRTLEVRPSWFLRRTLLAPLAGTASLVVALVLARLMGLDPEPTGALASSLTGLLPGPDRLVRAAPFLADLTLGTLAYIAGYLLVPAGRGDLDALKRRLWRSSPSPAAS